MTFADTFVPVSKTFLCLLGYGFVFNVFSSWFGTISAFLW